MTTAMDAKPALDESLDDDTRAQREALRAKLMRPGYQNLVLALVVIGFTLNFLDRQVLIILMQPLKEELGLSDSTLGLLSGLSFALFYATFGIPIARFADRGSRRLVMALSIGVWSAATAVCGLAQNVVQLFVARMFVGVGEAGFTPTGLALIADYFPNSKRGFVTGIVTMGPMFGMMLGLIVGGWAAIEFGWRTTFMLVGLPGVVFALVFWLVVKEPWRGMADGKLSTVVDTPPPMAATVSLLLKNRAYLFLILGAAMSAFSFYGVSTWVPSFFARSHGLDPQAIGLRLGPVIGIVGGVGTLAGGWFMDRLSARDPRWSVCLPALTSVVTLPFLVGVLLVPSTSAAIAFYAMTCFTSVIYIAPVYVMIQKVVPVEIRVTATAWCMLVVNIIGLGLGPQSIGIVSDLLAPALAGESLRYALLIVGTSFLAPAIFYLLAGRALKLRPA